MGAWGSGSFENDTALDWAAGVQSSHDLEGPFARLKAESDANDGYLVESDFACELLAAAECVAFMMGRPSRDFPEDLSQRLADAGEPDRLLYHRARNAVLHVTRNSELAELWEEAAQESGTNEWLIEITGLFDRLNPDLEVSPGETQEVEDQVGATAGTCAFCNGPIASEQLWGMNLYDAYDTNSPAKSLWCHLPCLNARLHHKYAIANLKFDPNNMPDLDQL